MNLRCINQVKLIPQISVPLKGLVSRDKSESCGVVTFARGCATAHRSRDSRYTISDLLPLDCYHYLRRRTSTRARAACRRPLDYVVWIHYYALYEDSYRDQITRICLLQDKRIFDNNMFVYLYYRFVKFIYEWILFISFFEYLFKKIIITLKKMNVKIAFISRNFQDFTLYRSGILWRLEDLRTNLLLVSVPPIYY